MKLKLVIYAGVMILVLSIQACVKSTVPSPTSQPPYANTPENRPAELFITSTNGFVDSYGTYHLVGEINNNTSTVLSSIELTIELKDATGNSLLTDENGNSTPNTKIYPLLYTLAPGNSSPFDYTYNTVNGTPASYKVTISGQRTGNANPASLQVENVQLMDNGTGWFFLTGKLINPGSQWVHINALAGAVLDDSNHLLSTNWTSTYATELAPSGDVLGRDLTPFEISFPNPGGATQWRLYQDVNLAENVTDYSMDVKVTNTYLDQYGSVHLIGWITNNSTQSLDSMVVAGLYSTDGTVLDSSYAFVPVPIKPGAVAPFSISSFGSVSNNPDQIALVSATSAQSDAYFTTPISSEFVDLAATGETVQKDGATWTFDGSVTNTSGKNLSGAMVVVMVMDAQNKLIAMEYTTIFPTGEAIAAGETNTYSVPVYLDPNVDATGFTTTSVVVGDVK